MNPTQHVESHDKSIDIFVFVGIILAIFLLLNAPLLLSLPLTIDAEMNLVRYSADVWVSQGRWGTYLLSQYLFTHPVVPFFYYAFFGVCISFSYIGVLKAAGLPMDRRAAALSAIFSSYPIWTFLLEFPANVPSAGVGVLCCSAAALALFSTLPKLFRFAIQVVLLAFAVSIYQVFILVYVAMVAACGLLGDRRDIWARVAFGAAAAAASLVAYFTVNHLFVSSFGYSQAYIGGFVNIPAILDTPVLVAKRTIAEAASVLGGSSTAYGSPLWASGIVVFLAALTLYYRFSLFSVVALVGLLAAPFLMTFLAGGSLPHRALLATPVALWALAYFCTTAPSIYARAAAYTVASALVFQSAVVIATHQAERLIVADFDRQTATLLADRISQVADLSKPTMIDIYGALQPPRLYPTGLHSTAAASFFSWDNGNPVRMLAYLRIRGMGTLDLAPPAQRSVLRPTIETLPIWPRPGSVTVRDGVVLVRLGQEPGYYPGL